MDLTTEKKIIFGIVGVTVAILIGGVILLSTPKPSQVAEVIPDNQKSLLVKSDSHQSTPQNAKVTLVEFADLQCPACASVNPTIEALNKEYKDRVNIVYRHFPLPSHKYAMDAAEALEAASEKGKFWEMKEKIFTNQKEWAESDNPIPFFEKYAQELGIEKDFVTKAIKEKKYETKIKADYNDGVALGVNSTPTFYVDGEKFAFVASFDELKELIDKKLEGK